MLAAKSIVYIDPKTGTSGKHVAEILSKLGIADEVNRKAKLGQGGYIIEPVGRGEIELGIHQISEILPVKGVKPGRASCRASCRSTRSMWRRRFPHSGKLPLVQALIRHLTGPASPGTAGARGLHCA